MVCRFRRSGPADERRVRCRRWRHASWSVGVWPGARSTDAVGIGLTFAAARLVESADALGNSLRVESTGMVVGPDDADVTLRGDPFELLRAITGRRSVGQLHQLAWEGDVERVIPAFWWYGLNPAAEDIDE